VLVYDQDSDFRSLGRAHLICHVRIFNRAPEPPVVILTELSYNPGMSVTSAGEHIATELRGRHPLLRASEPIWIEHYNGESYSAGLSAPDRFAHLSLAYNRDRYRHVGHGWRPLASSELQSMLGAPLEEFGFQPLTETAELATV
jgi:hypothetical protein